MSKFITVVALSMTVAIMGEVEGSDLSVHSPIGKKIHFWRTLRDEINELVRDYDDHENAGHDRHGNSGKLKPTVHSHYHHGHPTMRTTYPKNLTKPHGQFGRMVSHYSPTEKSSTHNHTLKPHIRPTTTKPHHQPTTTKPHHQPTTTKSHHQPTNKTARPVEPVPTCAGMSGHNLSRKDYEELLNVVTGLLKEQNYDTRRMIPWGACNEGPSKHGIGEKWVLTFYDSKIKREHNCVAMILHDAQQHKLKPRHNNTVTTAPVCRVKSVDLCPSQLTKLDLCSYPVDDSNV